MRKPRRADKVSHWKAQIAVKFYDIEEVKRLKPVELLELLASMTARHADRLEAHPRLRK